MSFAMRIPVLMYHQIGDPINNHEARYSIPRKRFAAHMQILARSGYQAISINAFVEWLEGGADLPEGSFLLTFDDGYRGIYLHALSVLESLGWPFSVFLVSDLIGGRDIWTMSANPRGNTYELLNYNDIQYMQQKGASFNSHSRSHRSLPTLNDADLLDQVLSSRNALEELLGHNIDYFAYPYGQFDERVIAATKSAGYRASFSTRSGFNQRKNDLFSIRRIDVYGTDTPAMLLRKIRLGTNDGSLKSLLIYYLHRIGLK